MQYAHEKDVLDIACGEGYGCAILAETARSVVGVDIAAEAVRHAAIRYQRDNVHFRLGSCIKIPLDNHSIDLVVSFETIEHLDEHKAMMAEIKRVLRPSGVLLISSPDKKEYSILRNYRNPFHVRELFKEEFEDLIEAYFKNQALLSQRIVYGSAILPEASAFGIVDYDINNDSSHPGLARPQYLIALASDAPLPLFSGGLLEQAVEESENVKSRSELIIQLEDKNRQLEEQLRSQASQSQDQIQQLEKQLQSQASRSEDQIQQFEKQLRLKPLNLKTKSSSSKSSFVLKSLNLKTKSSSLKNSFSLRSLNPQARSANSKRKLLI